MHREWIVPPGLLRSFKQFQSACEDHFAQPIEKQHPFLIKGPTGVGKSLFVEYYRQELFKHISKNANVKPNSGKERQKKKNVSQSNDSMRRINCATLPSELIESELFGYKEGAHSQAVKEKKGLFEIVGNGLIVLEEIGEMSIQLQAKLLIVIEEREFQVIGDEETSIFEGHVIATTNVDKEKIRPDLWYRFDVFEVPPIHQRRGDILYYLFGYELGIYQFITPKSVIALLAYDWPGNVREIESVATHIRRESRNINYENKMNAFIFLEDLFSHVDDFLTNIKSFSVDLKILESVLASGGIEFTDKKLYLIETSCVYTYSSYLKAIHKTFFHKEYNRKQKIGDNITIINVDQFDETFIYFSILCGLTFSDVLSEKNVLHSIGSTFPKDLEALTSVLSSSEKEELQKLFLSIFCALFKGKISGKRKTLPFNKIELKEYFEKLLSANMEDSFLLSILNKEKKQHVNKSSVALDINDITEDDLLLYYYQHLLRIKKENGVEVAKIANRSPNTLQGKNSKINRLLKKTGRAIENYQGYRVEICKE